MRLRALLLAVPLAFGGLVVPAHADEPVTVVWDTATEIDADWHGYSLTVTDNVAEPERGELYAEWQGDRHAIPHNGGYTMDFVTGGIGTVKIIRCAGEPITCVDTGVESPTIDVYKSASIGLEDLPSYFVREGAHTARMRAYGSEVHGAVVDLTWSVRRAGEHGDVVSSGPARVTIDSAGRGTFGFTLPKTAGEYLELWIEGAADIGSFGPHRVRASTQRFAVDGTPPRIATKLSATTFYPVRDGYQDFLLLSSTSNEWTRGKVEIVRNGTVVRRLSLQHYVAHEATFNGRSSSGQLLPAGTYVARFSLADDVGHVVTANRTFTLSRKRLVTRHFRRTYTAASTILRNGVLVERCSTLARPSARGWAGSLGFYSQTKCRRPADSAVLTVNGVYVPKSVQARYGKLRVTLYGGGSARGVRRGRNAYIVLTYSNRGNDLTARAQFDGRLGSHAGRLVSGADFVKKKTTKPYVVWGVGLSEGSNYDVKSYTVDLDYTVLR